MDNFQPWRELICTVLRARPELRVVVEIADGLEAVQKANELLPDLVVLAIDLPTLSGIEAAKRLQQVAPGVKIIFVTLNSDKEVVRAALNTGAQGYVLKADVGTELLTAVAAVLGGDNYVSSGVNRG